MPDCFTNEGKFNTGFAQKINMTAHASRWVESTPQQLLYINVSTNCSEMSRCILRGRSHVASKKWLREILQLCCCWATEARAVKAPPSSGKWPGAAAHLHLKGHTQKQRVFAHTQIGANLTSYNKWYNNTFWGHQRLILYTCIII